MAEVGSQVQLVGGGQHCHRLWESSVINDGVNNNFDSGLTSQGK